MKGGLTKEEGRGKGVEGRWGRLVPLALTPASLREVEVMMGLNEAQLQT